MRLVISDDPVADVKMALAKELHDRVGVMNSLVEAGHVTVLYDDDPLHIRVRVEDEVFTDSRERFPSTVLMARLQLAIKSGRSERNNPDAAVERASVWGTGDLRHLYQRWVETMEMSYHNVADITRGPTKPLLKVKP